MLIRIFKASRKLLELRNKVSRRWASSQAWQHAILNAACLDTHQTAFVGLLVGSYRNEVSGEIIYMSALQWFRLRGVGWCCFVVRLFVRGREGNLALLEGQERNVSRERCQWQVWSSTLSWTSLWSINLLSVSTPRSIMAFHRSVFIHDFYGSFGLQYLKKCCHLAGFFSFQIPSKTKYSEFWVRPFSFPPTPTFKMQMQRWWI